MQTSLKVIILYMYMGTLNDEATNTVNDIINTNFVLKPLKYKTEIATKK